MNALSRKRRRRLLALRNALFSDQAGACCYCERAMAGRHEPTRIAAARLGIRCSEVRSRRATIEHLKRRADGGGNQPGNLRASCEDCNFRRQGHDWLTWKSICLGEIAA